MHDSMREACAQTDYVCGACDEQTRVRTDGRRVNWLRGLWMSRTERAGPECGTARAGEGQERFKRGARATLDGRISGQSGGYLRYARNERQLAVRAIDS